MRPVFVLDVASAAPPAFLAHPGPTFDAWDFSAVFVLRLPLLRYESTNHGTMALYTPAAGCIVSWFQMTILCSYSVATSSVVVLLHVFKRVPRVRTPLHWTIVSFHAFK